MSREVDKTILLRKSMQKQIEQKRIALIEKFYLIKLISDFAIDHGGITTDSIYHDKVDFQAYLDNEIDKGVSIDQIVTTIERDIYLYAKGTFLALEKDIQNLVNKQNQFIKSKKIENRDNVYGFPTIARMESTQNLIKLRLNRILEIELKNQFGLSEFDVFVLQTQDLLQKTKIRKKDWSNAHENFREREHQTALVKNRYIGAVVSVGKWIGKIFYPLFPKK